MSLLLPPERPQLRLSGNMQLGIQLWFLQLVTTLGLFVAGVLSNWGLILYLVSTCVLTLAIVSGLLIWQKYQFRHRLAVYEKAYYLWAKQRRKYASPKSD